MSNGKDRKALGVFLLVLCMLCCWSINNKLWNAIISQHFILNAVNFHFLSRANINWTRWRIKKRYVKTKHTTQTETKHTSRLSRCVHVSLAAAVRLLPFPLPSVSNDSARCSQATVESKGGGRLKSRAVLHLCSWGVRHTHTCIIKSHRDAFGVKFKWDWG